MELMDWALIVLGAMTMGVLGYAAGQALHTPKADPAPDADEFTASMAEWGYVGEARGDRE